MAATQSATAGAGGGVSNEWTAFDFQIALVNQTIANLGVYNPVPQVIDYAPSREESLSSDLVVIGAFISDDNEVVVLGAGRYDEIVTLESRVSVVRPGAGQVVATAAKTRAKELLGEVDTELRTNPPKVGDQTLRAAVASRDARFYPFQAGETAVRVAIIDFQIVYTARTSKT